MEWRLKRYKFYEISLHVSRYVQIKINVSEHENLKLLDRSSSVGRKSSIAHNGYFLGRRFMVCSRYPRWMFCGLWCLAPGTQEMTKSYNLFSRAWIKYFALEPNQEGSWMCFLSWNAFFLRVQVTKNLWIASETNIIFWKYVPIKTGMQ
jgi:hypothetical protein